MTSNFIYGIIRRSNLNQFLLAFILLIGTIGAVMLAGNYYNNMFNGPFEASPRQILDIEDVNSLDEYYVTVKGEEALDTGYQMVTTNNGVETSHESYVALVFKDQFLLVQVPGDASDSKKYTGSLVPISSEVQREILDPLFAEEPSIKKYFLPFMLDTGDFRTRGYIAIGAVILLVLVCLWALLRTIRRMGDSSRHPIMRGLARFGDAEQFADQIESEMNQDHEMIGKYTHLTRNWLVYRTASTFSAIRLSDTAWIYKHILQRRAYGIAAGKTFTAYIYDKYGTCMKIPGKEPIVNGVLQAVVQHCPWCHIGYTKAVEESWKKNRVGFLAAVDQRRTQAR